MAPSISFSEPTYTIGEGNVGAMPIVLFREGPLSESIMVMIEFEPITAQWGTDLLQLPL